MLLKEPQNQAGLVPVCDKPPELAEGSPRRDARWGESWIKGVAGIVPILQIKKQAQEGQEATRGHTASEWEARPPIHSQTLGPPRLGPLLGLVFPLGGPRQGSISPEQQSRLAARGLPLPA